LCHANSEQHERHICPFRQSIYSRLAGYEDVNDPEKSAAASLRVDRFNFEASLYPDSSFAPDLLLICS